MAPGFCYTGAVANMRGGHMKIFHLSDLHIGKRVYEYSMIPDQEYILARILEMIREEKPDALIIAGDVYDRPVPPREAVTLMDVFLEKAAELCPAVFMISGNHDSAERIAFGGGLMEKSGVYLSPVYGGSLKRVRLEDGEGPVDFYLLPFVRPVNIRKALEAQGSENGGSAETPDAPEPLGELEIAGAQEMQDAQEIHTYTEAVARALEGLPVDHEARNVLVSHQFVTGASRCESEEVSIGGLDNVDASAYKDFDYVALGHIHSPQNVAGEEDQVIRYSGTPLKYSFSEAGQEKSVTVVNLEKGKKPAVKTLNLTPLREMVELKGSYEEITARDFYKGTTWQEDYVHITLTDEEDVPDAAARLRTIYKNLMRIDYDNRRTRSSWTPDGGEEIAERSPEELIEEFFQKMNDREMSRDQRDLCTSILRSLDEQEPER